MYVCMCMYVYTYVCMNINKAQQLTQMLGKPLFSVNNNNSNKYGNKNAGHAQTKLHFSLSKLIVCYCSCFFFFLYWTPIHIIERFFLLISSCYAWLGRFRCVTYRFNYNNDRTQLTPKVEEWTAKEQCIKVVKNCTLTNKRNKNKWNKQVGKG